MAKRKTLFEKALNTNYYSRFIAVSEDLNRDLTDEEVKENAKYYLETIDYSGYDESWIKETKRQLKKLLK